MRTSHHGQRHQPLGCKLRLPSSSVPATTRPRGVALCALALPTIASSTKSAASPEGQVTWGVHVSLAPTWFDPAEMSGIITPYSYPDIDALLEKQAGELDATNRAALLDRMQEPVNDTRRPTRMPRLRTSNDGEVQ